MGLAERADTIVDFMNVPVGNHVLRNIGPDEPFGGGEPPDDLDLADPDTTGQIMRFDVVPAVDADDSTPPQFLSYPRSGRCHRRPSRGRWHCSRRCRRTSTMRRPRPCSARWRETPTSGRER